MRRGLLAAAAFLGMVATVVAQDRQDQLGAVAVTYRGQLSRWQEGSEVLLVVTGNVGLIAGDLRLRADRVIAWTRPDDKEVPLREVYLEGHVVAHDKDPKTKRDMTLQADRLYYDFVARRMYLVDVVVRTYSDDLKSPIVMRARELREVLRETRLIKRGEDHVLVTRGQMVAWDMTVTTCTYGVPHYHVGMRTATLRGERSEPASLEGIGKSVDSYQIWPYSRTWSMRGDGLYLDLFGAPIPIAPALEVSSALASMPLNSVRGGYTRRFRYWVETDWGLDIPKGVVDALNPFDTSTEEDDRRKWGELKWEMDYRRKRGYAGGLDLEWKGARSRGMVDSYYLRDKGGDPDIDFDAQYIGEYGEDRGRVRFFQRSELAAVEAEHQFRFELEASYLSDRALLPEFFEREFKEDKEQETVAYGRWVTDFMGGYVLERHRLNDFQTQNEYLPRVRYFLYDVPLGWGVGVSGQVDTGLTRTRYDEDLHQSTQDVWRLDVMGELTRPVDLYVATLAPLARLRSTLYDEDASGDSRHRFIGTAGVRLTSEVAGVHDLEWEGIGLRKIRHRMAVEGSWMSNWKASVEPSELVAFDDTDRLDEFDEVAFQMRHRLLTKREDGVPFEFMTLGLAMEHYPHSGRDTTTLNANNYLPPFYWMTLAPHDSSGIREERSWSNLSYDGAFNAGDAVRLSVVGEYNFHHDQEESRVASLSVKPLSSLTATAGTVFSKGAASTVALGLDWVVTEKWHVVATGQYDYDLRTFLKWRGVVSRDFHDFNVELVTEVDETRDERLFYVTVVPKFLGQARFKRG